MADRLINPLLRGAHIVRGGLSRLARRSSTAELLLQEAGVDVDRLANQRRRR